MIATKETPVKIKWAFDTAHSEIGFKVKHLMISNVKGSFKEFGALIYTNDENFTGADIDIWIEAASITTGDDKRDEHLKGPDFFDVSNHKLITFTGNTYEKKGDEETFELYGDLTIKGVAKRIKLDVEFGGHMKDPWGNEKAGFTVTGKINRKEWGLNWNAALEAGGILVSEDIHIICEVQLSKQA